MVDFIQFKNELEQLKEDADKKILRLSEIEKSMQEQENNLKYVSDAISKKLGDIIEKEKFLGFFQKPYVTIPQGKNNLLVAVPKFIKGFQVGWLWKETESFYIYQLDQYSAWLGDVPQELLNEINFKKEIDGVVQGDTLFYSPMMKEAVKKKLGYHLKDIGETEARIVRGHIFDVIADMIENGCLPFKPMKVSKEDLREQKSQIKLREYQKATVDKFMETGAVGSFLPTGSGKSFIALYLMDVITGKKIIIVPTRTLIEQWNYYIETYIPDRKEEIKIATYQGYRDSEDEFSLVVYDECQRLPADTFSRLSVIKAKYRIGLSASPHREDGRESYIFALTGFPIGLNWKEYMETVGKSYHPVYVHIVYSSVGKIRKLDELVDFNKKTLIYCDTIELGKKIANQYNIPYIYGQTSNRLDEIENNRVLVVSRVMDLGVSIKDLQRIIEVDFLFGSRGQELQRTGRLMHSENAERHDIIMTEEEVRKYGKRLWALTEKGFDVKIKE